jgi:hypothetical protein
MSAATGVDGASLQNQTLPHVIKLVVIEPKSIAKSDAGFVLRHDSSGTIGELRSSGIF